MASMNFNTSNQTFRHLMGNGDPHLSPEGRVSAILAAAPYCFYALEMVEAHGTGNGNCRENMRNIGENKAQKAEAAPRDGLVTPSTHGR